MAPKFIHNKAYLSLLKPHVPVPTGFRYAVPSILPPSFLLDSQLFQDLGQARGRNGPD